MNEIVLVPGFSAEAIRREINAQNVRMLINESYQPGMGTSLQPGLSVSQGFIPANRQAV